MIKLPKEYLGSFLHVNEASDGTRDFGKNKVEDITPSDNAEENFAKTMTALTDDNYEAFVDDLNKLADDPKLEALKKAVVDNFNKKEGKKGGQRFAIKFGDADLKIKNIHPTQHEVDMEKSLAFPLKKNPAGIKDAFSGKPIIINKTPIVAAKIGSTYYIIDGHHRWSQTYCLNPDASMKAKVIESEMFKNADDILKLVQMQLFIAKNGGELPQATVDSKYNLYTIEEKAFKDWVNKTMVNDA